MAVVLRLRRTGRKNLPCFRIVAADTRFPRDGRLIESLGLYDPLRKDPAAQVHLDVERARYWLSVGARPSDVVASIFRKRGIHAVVPAQKRERPGRGRPTKTREQREKLSAERAHRKAARLAERRKAKRAAAKAASADAAAAASAGAEKPA